MSGYVCPECDLDYEALDAGSLGARIRDFAPLVRDRLARVDDTALRTRPEPKVWSAIEYAAHLADAYDAFVDMTDGMPKGVSMRNFFWDPDERAIEKGYNQQPLDTVLGDVDMNANRLADAFDNVSDDGWSITAEFPWGERDLLTMARNAVHEGVHHTQDIEQVLDRVSASGA
jgi:hypothetical protein